eukprot:jgi/Mesvir1/21970/Mv08636-RA.1
MSDNDTSNPTAGDNETVGETRPDKAAEQMAEATEAPQIAPANHLQDDSDQEAGAKSDVLDIHGSEAETAKAVSSQKVKDEASEEDMLPGILTAEKPSAKEPPKPSLATNKASIAGANSLPARDYLETVVPALRQCLRSLLKERPDDPMGFLADYFNSRRTK